MISPPQHLLRRTLTADDDQNSEDEDTDREDDDDADDSDDDDTSDSDDDDADDGDDVAMCGQGLFAAISLLPLSEFQDNRLVFTSQLNDDDQD